MKIWFRSFLTFEGMLDQPTQMKKLNTSGFAGIAAAAILAVVGFTPSANAQLNFSPGFTGGFVSIKYSNFDMGTLYPTQGNGSYGVTNNTAAGSAALNLLPGQIAPTNPAGLTGLAEDSWGIARLSTIEDFSSNTIWSQIGTGQEVTVIFYGSQDFFLSKDGTQQVTSSYGLHIDLYLQTVGSPGYTAYNPSLGSAGRTSQSTYNTVTDGTLLLSTVSTAGFLYAPGVEGGTATEFTSTFAPGVNGKGSAYLNVTGGTMASQFNTNSIQSVFNPGLFADLRVEFTTQPNSGPGSVGNPTGDWLVRSNDPVTAFIVPVPEPSTYGLVAAGALLGLVAFRRMKARSQAV
jgi:hypothetical protein